MGNTTHKTPPLAEMLSKLIGTPSVSSVSPQYDQGNLPVIELLENWCSSLGMQTEILPVSGNKANLIASTGKWPAGLVLSGHTDTVPYDDGRWQTDPFQLTEKNNRFYGLGTADMKSFFALALAALQRIDTSKLQQPVILLATADEESTMSGARALVSAGKPRARYAVIGEPTGMRPVHMHKGIMMESLRITGQSGHSSDPSLGNSALEGMHRVITALLEWRRELQGEYQDTAFAVPMPTMNLGHIHGGDNPNRICGECELQVDLRPLPGMDIDELRQELVHRSRQALVDSGLELTSHTLFSGIPAMQTPADASLARLAEQLTGHAPEAVAFGTEAPYLQQLCEQVIVLGPGHIDQAHQPDEFIDHQQINPMIDILEQLIIKSCMHPRQSR